MALSPVNGREGHYRLARPNLAVDHWYSRVCRTLADRPTAISIYCTVDVARGGGILHRPALAECTMRV